MKKNKINIGWYTRAGHIVLWSKVSQKLQSEHLNVNNHYVCHSANEKKKLINEFNIDPFVLGDFFENADKIEDIDLHIKKLEKEYPFKPLRMLLWSEMFEMKTPENVLIRRLILHFKFWEDFLKKTKVEMIFSEGPSILSTCVLWVVCKKYNVKLIELAPVGVPGTKNFRSSWGDGVDNLYNRLDKIKVDKDSENYAKSLDYYNKMIKNPERPLYANIDIESGKNTENKSYKFFPKFHKKLDKNFLIKILKYKSYDNYYLNKTNFSSFYIDWLKTKLKYFYIKNSNIFNKVDYSKNFFLFPLHISNEWTDYTYMGLKYPHVIDLIKKIACCLPLNSKLYVKEHPSLFPHKSISFYKKIKKISNVFLIGPSENNFKLIKNSKGIITLGATTGWEAFIIGKPVISFCNIWYGKLDGIYRVRDEFDLVEILQNSEKLPLPKLEYKVKVIYTLFEISFKAEHYPLIRMLSDKNIDRVKEAISKYILKDSEFASS